MLSEEFADRQRAWKAITLTDLWNWEQKSKDLESENAELKKYLKHARDDKKIRLGEIEVLEAKVDGLKELVRDRSEEIARLWNELVTVLDVAIARGEKLDYEDLDYRELFKNLTNKDWEHENPPT